MTTPSWFVFLKVDTGTHNHLAHYGLLLRVTQPPAPTREWPRCHRAQCHSSSWLLLPQPVQRLRHPNAGRCWTAPAHSGPACQPALLLSRGLYWGKRMKGWGFQGPNGGSPQEGDTRGWAQIVLHWSPVSTPCQPPLSLSLFICKAVITLYLRVS